jgi:hypothetical protein
MYKRKPRYPFLRQTESEVYCLKRRGKSCLPAPQTESRSLYFSHFWLATVQEVLQADWQDAWHSPQPPFAALCLRFGLFSVLTCFISVSIPFIKPSARKGSLLK